MSAKEKKITVLLIALCLCVVDILLYIASTHMPIMEIVRSTKMGLNSGLDTLITYLFIAILAFCAIGIFGENRQTGLSVCAGGIMFISVLEMLQGIFASIFNSYSSNVFNLFSCIPWIVLVLISVMLLFAMNNDNINKKMLIACIGVGIVLYIIAAFQRGIYGFSRVLPTVLERCHFPLFILSVVYLLIKAGVIMKDKERSYSAYSYLDEYKRSMSSTNYSYLAEYKRSAKGVNLSYLAEYKRTTK